MYIDVRTNSREAIRCRVFLDDVEVSRNCFAADDEKGFVLVYKTNERGHKYREGDEVSWERKEGVVRIEQK